MIWSIALLRRLFHSVLSLRQPSQNGDGRAVPQWRRRMRRRRWGRYPLDDGKAKRLHS